MPTSLSTILFVKRVIISALKLNITPLTICGHSKHSLVKIGGHDTLRRTRDLKLQLEVRVRGNPQAPESGLALSVMTGDSFPR